METKKNIINRISDVPGGVSLTLADLVAGKVVEEANPLSAPATGKRTVCKQSKILTGSTTTILQVDSDTNNFKVGDFVLRIEGGLAYAVTDITDNEDGTDAITVGTALESATVGEFIYQADAESATTTSALENKADCILKEAFQVPEDAQVIWMADGFYRADVVEASIGSLYLADLDVNEVKY